MISVIIPIYNTEHYLRRCIDSVLASACKDIEVILINDGSTDHSAEICRKYCRKDARVRFIDQKKKGVSAARNRGIDESRGEWIVFVDSDDFVSGDFLETVAKKKYQSQDMLIFNYEKWDKRKRWEKGERKRTGEISYNGRENAGKLIEKLLRAQQLESGGKANLRSPCAKAYKKSVLDRYKIRFPEQVSMGEDRLFNIEYQWRAWRRLYIPQTAYFVQWRKESASHSFHSDYIQRDYRLQKAQRQLLKNCSLLPALENAYYDSVLSNLTHVLIKGIFSPYSPRSYRENCRLCERVKRGRLYREALQYAGQSGDKIGILPRRVLLWCYRRQCYGIVNLLCRLCYGILLRI